MDNNGTDIILGAAQQQPEIRQSVPKLVGKASGQRTKKNSHCPMYAGMLLIALSRLLQLNEKSGFRYSSCGQLK